MHHFIVRDALYCWLLSVSVSNCHQLSRLMEFCFVQVRKREIGFELWLVLAILPSDVGCTFHSVDRNSRSSYCTFAVIAQKYSSMQMSLFSVIFYNYFMLFFHKFIHKNSSNIQRAQCYKVLRLVVHYEDHETFLRWSSEGFGCLVKQWAFPHFFFFFMQDTEQSQSRITVCLFTLVVTVLAKPEENRGRARFYVVDQPCQRMSVIKALLSVLLSPPTQRSLSEIRLCTDRINAFWNWIKRENKVLNDKTSHEKS